MKFLTVMLAAALTAGFGFGSGAQAQSLGETEYMNSCAYCHGIDGTGDGPLAGYLNTALPDLTQLQTQNGGVFPVTRLYESIDGTAELGAHGTREMPAWGLRYMTRGAEGANPDTMAEEAEVFARARILALIEYIASLQME